MSKNLRKRFLYPFLRLTQLVNDQGDLGATSLSSEVQAVNVMLPIKAAMTNKLNFLILNYYLTGY